MKQVFRCNYCNYMGTSEEVTVHEPECVDNYNMESCFTCVHKNGMKLVDKKIKYECDKGRDIPAGNVYQHCELYNRKEKEKYETFGNFFDDLFGRINR